MISNRDQDMLIILSLTNKLHDRRYKNGRYLMEKERDRLVAKWGVTGQDMDNWKRTHADYIQRMFGGKKRL